MEVSSTNPVVERTKRMQEEGLKLLGSGAIKPYDVSIELPKLKNRYSVVMKFDTQHVRRIADGLQGFVQNFAPAFDMIIAGIDYPLHATLGEAVTGNEASDRFDGLECDPRITAIDLMLPTEIVFDTLVLDRMNLLLTTSEIPASILKVRELLGQIYAHHGFQYLEIHNLLHITLARICRLSEDEEYKMFKLKAYTACQLDLREVIRHQPLAMEPQLWRGPTTELFEDLIVNRV